MKIKYGLAKFDENIHNSLLNNGWKPLKEPKNIGILILLSIPFIIVNIFISWAIIDLFYEGTLELTIGGLYEFIRVMLFVGLITVATLALHEILHLIFVPKFISSDKTYIGFTWFVGYVYSEEIITKRRMCIIFLAPFVIISIVLNITLGIFNLYSLPILAFIFINSSASCTDMLCFFLILFQVPNGSKIVNNGMKTYYR